MKMLPCKVLRKQLVYQEEKTTTAVPGTTSFYSYLMRDSRTSFHIKPTHQAIWTRFSSRVTFNVRNTILLYLTYVLKIQNLYIRDGSNW